MKRKGLESAGRIWAALGVGDQVKGRTGFAAWVILLLIAGIAGLHGAIGATAAVIVSVCAAGVLIGLWVAIVAVLEGRDRRAQEAWTGTWIPPDHAAIIDGEPIRAGEWVPPGFSVVMDVGVVTDDKGNSAQGAGARVYCSRGSLAIGGQVGRRPY